MSVYWEIGKSFFISRNGWVVAEISIRFIVNTTWTKPSLLGWKNHIFYILGNVLFYQERGDSCGAISLTHPQCRTGPAAVTRFFSYFPIFQDLKNCPPCEKWNFEVSSCPIDFLRVTTWSWEERWVGKHCNNKNVGKYYIHCKAINQCLEPITKMTVQGTMVQSDVCNKEATTKV